MYTNAFPHSLHVGPFLGGYVTKFFSEQFSAALAALLCVVAILIVIATVPRTTRRLVVDDSKDKKHGEENEVERAGIGRGRGEGGRIGGGKN